MCTKHALCFLLAPPHVNDSLSVCFFVKNSQTFFENETRKRSLHQWLQWLQVVTGKKSTCNLVFINGYRRLQVFLKKKNF